MTDESVVGISVAREFAAFVLEPVILPPPFNLVFYLALTGLFGLERDFSYEE